MQLLKVKQKAAPHMDLKFFQAGQINELDCSSESAFADINALSLLSVSVVGGLKRHRGHGRTWHLFISRHSFNTAVDCSALPDWTCMGATRPR